MTSYKRIQVVGKGSFGCCWLVKNAYNDRCILKEIDVSTISKKAQQEAATEVTVLKGLKHPFIIQYKEAFVEGSLLCIIMEFAERGDLYQVIERQRKSGTLLVEGLVLRWFTQIVLALKHVHERHILHRDLKTQNIFLAGSGLGQVKVGDFGVARVLQNTFDCARTYVGTPYYCSPEICQEQPYSYKSDVWSLGCVVYELATLRHAFNADSMRHLVNKILRSMPQELPSVFSDELRSLISQMLTKDPRRRPSVFELQQNPLVRHMIQKQLVELQKQKECPSEKSRCTSPAKSPVRSPTAAKVARPEMPTPPKAPKAIKERRPNLGPKPGRFGPRSESRESNRSARSPSPTSKCKTNGNGVTVAKLAVQKISHAPASKPDVTQVESKVEVSQGERCESKDLIRTLEEGLSCKEPAAIKECIQPVGDGRTCPCFTNPEGDDVKLQVTETDSLAYRIEALRLYIEQQLGISEFLLVYKHLTGSTDGDNTETDGILSSKARSFFTLVTQLIVCEDRFYA